MHEQFNAKNPIALSLIIVSGPSITAVSQETTKYFVMERVKCWPCVIPPAIDSAAFSLE